jgi:hypothetical protein
MAGTVTFLGYTLTFDENTGVIKEPQPQDTVVQYPAGGWNAFAFWNEKQNSCWLNLNLGGYIGSSRRIGVVSDFDCELVDGVWTPSRLRSGRPALWVIPNDLHNPLPKKLIDLRLRPLDFQTDDVPGLGVRDGRIVVQGSVRSGEDAPHTWVTDLSSPLALTEWSIPIDLAKGVARIDNGALTLKASAIQQTNAGQVEAFVRNHVSRGLVEIPLGGASANLSVVFDATESKRLPLHVDVLDRSKSIDAKNPLVASLSIDDYTLQVDLVRKGDKTVATAVTALAKAANISLTTHFLCDQSNVASVWNSPGPISVGVRSGDDARPGSLLIISPSLAVDPVSSSSIFVHGVARDAEFASSGSAVLVLDTDSEPVHGTATGFGDTIVREVTYPYFSWSNSRKALSSESLKVMHAGRSTLPEKTNDPSTSSFVEQVKLSGTKLALPIYDPARLVQTDATGAAKHQKFLDGLIAGASYALVETSHDSGRIKAPPQGGSQMTLTTLFASTKGVAEYKEYGVVYQLGDRFSVTCLDTGKDHVLIDDSVTFTHNFDKFLGDDTSPFGILRVSTGKAGILKLSRDRTLSEILAENQLSVDDLPDEINGNTQWIGLLLLNVVVGANSKSELVPMIGPTELTMPYLAITAKDTAKQYDFCGELSFKQSGSIPPPADEANFRINEVHVVWQSSTLQTLDINSKLTVAGFLGLRLPQPLSIDVNGRYDRSTKSVRFASRFDPIDLLPGTVQQAPIQKVEVTSLDMAFSNGAATIVMGGSVTAGPFALGSFSIGASAGVPVDFSGLALRLNGAGLTPVQITIDYNALQPNLDNLSFGWGGFQISLTGISMPTAGDTIWSLPTLFSGGNASPPGDTTKKTTAVTLSISLMKLPALAAKSVDRLTLNLVIGMLPNGGNWSSDFWARISAVDFSGLQLDLLQFLTFRIGQLTMGQPNGIAQFTARGVEVDVLNQNILSLNVTIFHNGHVSGFLAFVAPKVSSGFFNVSWLLAGHNISLVDNDPLVLRLITINPSGTDDVDKLGSDIAGLGQNLIPTGEGNGRWIFGAGIHIGSEVVGGQTASLLDGRAIFQDEGFCGIALRSDLLKEWFNLDLSIGIAYRRGTRPEQDSFFVAVTVPQVTLPAFDFMGGVITLEIAMNGDFRLDVGFPSLGADGVSRAWDRCFGAVVAIYQGSGGFYLTKGSYRGPQVNSLTFGGGYAIQAGFGASFGAGIFNVVVTVGIYAIVEGNFVLENKQLVQFVLVGAVGVVFRGIGELNWWIISVTVSIVVAAEARTTIGWTTSAVPVLNGIPGAPPPGKTEIDFDFTVWASVSAQACIGGRWFHVCKSIGVSVPMRVSYRIQLN